MLKDSDPCPYQNMRMSKSRVLVYQNCPYNFKLQYIEKFRDSEDEPPQGSPLTKGTEIHKIFEDYYAMPEARDVKNADDIYKLLQQHPFYDKKKLAEEDPYCLNLDKKYFDYEALQSEYNTQLQNFAAFNEAMIKRYGVEHYIPEYRELSLYNKERNFLGIIDRAEEMPDGRFNIYDYKTGNAGTLKKYLLELGLYKYLFEAETGNEVHEVGIYFSKVGKLRKIVLDQNDVQRSLDKLEWTVRNIVNENFPRKKTFLCNYCSNHDICKLDLDF